MKKADLVVVALFVGFAGGCASAEMQFVGVMADAKQTLFAVRADDAAPAKWVSFGDTVGEFVVSAYDSKIETLTLRKGPNSVVLKLPESRVGMAADEVLGGLKRILNLPRAEQMRDLLHPMLRPLFKNSDLDSTVFRDVLAPGSSAEILPLTEEETKVLESGLSEIERVVGLRPKHGLWIKSAKHRSMSFVVNTGGGWYLAPSAPEKE